METNGGRLGRKIVVLGLLTLAAASLLLSGASAGAAAHRDHGHRAGAACARAFMAGVKLEAMLNEMVAEGAIEGADAQAILDRLEAERPARAALCDGILLAGNRPVGRAISELLGMDRSEIREAWLDGQSLAEMAEAQGIDRQALVDAAVNALAVSLDERVADGTLTVDERDLILERARGVIERAVDLHRGELRDLLEGEEGQAPDAGATLIISEGSVA